MRFNLSFLVIFGFSVVTMLTLQQSDTSGMRDSYLYGNVGEFLKDSGRSGRLVGQGRQARSQEQFELISWLVIKPAE